MRRRGDMIGVILAAGVGTRIRPLSAVLPKPLLPVCNEPIAEHQLDAMRAIGIDEFRIVVAPLDDRVKAHFGDGSRFGVSITYVVQPVPLGIAHAVLQCASSLDRPFLVFLGDIFFVPRSLGTMLDVLREHRAGAVLAVRREDDPALLRRNFATVLRPDGTVARVVEKPRHPPSNQMGCGIYLFDLPALDAIARTPRTAMRDEYEITSSIQILIDDGLPVRVAEVVEWDVNVTTPSDLLRCNRLELARRGLSALASDSAQIHPGATLDGSVVGDGAQVLHPIVLKDCLVLPGAVIDSKGDLEGKVITPELILSCGEAGAAP